MDVFSSVIINNLPLPNRLCFAPVNTGFFSAGHLEEDMFRFQLKRAGKHIGTTYVGNVSVNPNTVTNPKTAYFSEDNLHEWIKLTNAICVKGSVPAVQLGCRLSEITPMREWINSNPKEYIRQAGAEIVALDKEKLDIIAEDYFNAAKFAWRCGFKIIQIHAAHGYLLSLLCNPIFNNRDDEYNAYELTFLKKMIQRMSDELPSAVLDIRLSFLQGIYDRESEIKAGFSLLDKVVKTPVHMISVSNGIYNINKNYIYPPETVKEDEYISLGIALAEKYRGKYWNIAGNLQDIGKLCHIKGCENLLFSFGRQLICDPSFIYKYVNGNKEDIVWCTHCGKCHYYSCNKESMAETCCDFLLES